MQRWRPRSLTARIAEAALHLLLLQRRRKRRIDEHDGGARRLFLSVRPSDRMWRPASDRATGNFFRKQSQCDACPGGGEVVVVVVEEERGGGDEGRPLSSMSEPFDTAAHYG